MGKSSKRRPGRKASRSPSRKDGYRPLDPKQDTYDNKSFLLCPVFRGHPELTAAFKTHVVPSSVFKAGLDDDHTGLVALQAIFDLIISSLENIMTLDDEMQDALQQVVERCFNSPSHTDDAFRFRVLSDPTAPVYTFVDATRDFHPQPDGALPPVYCLIPNSIVLTIWNIVDTILESRPDDEAFESSMLFFRPDIRSSYRQYRELKDSPDMLQAFGSTTPRKFTDTLYQSPSRDWVSSIVFTSLEVEKPAGPETGTPQRPLQSDSRPPQDPLSPGHINQVSSDGTVPKPDSDKTQRNDPSSSARDSTDAGNTPRQARSVSFASPQQPVNQPTSDSRKQGTSSTPSELFHKIQHHKRHERLQSTQAPSVPQDISSSLSGSTESLDPRDQLHQHATELSPHWSTTQRILEDTDAEDSFNGPADFSKISFDTSRASQSPSLKASRAEVPLGSECRPAYLGL